MNQRLTEKLATLPETLGKTTNAIDVTNAVVEVERLVLKSNYEDRQSRETSQACEKREYVVGEANTRGLSWKLNLFRAIADATFCRMVRVGIHGGNILVLGQPENIDTTLQIYEALVPAYDTLGATAFAGFSEGRKAEEGAPAVNRTGWINQWLITAPTELAEALTESRIKDASSNGKLAALVSEQDMALKEFQASLTPARVARETKEPKTPKAPKAPRSSKSGKPARNPEGNGEVDVIASESEASDSTADDSDAYPGADEMPAEGDTAEQARADASS